MKATMRWLRVSFLPVFLLLACDGAGTPDASPGTPDAPPGTTPDAPPGTTPDAQPAADAAGPASCSAADHCAFAAVTSGTSADVIGATYSLTDGTLVQLTTRDGKWLSPVDDHTWAASTTVKPPLSSWAASSLVMYGAAGGETQLRKSVNGGADWTTEVVPGSAPVQHVHLGSGIFVVVSGAPAQVFHRSSVVDEAWTASTLPALASTSTTYSGINGGAALGYKDILVGTDGSKALVLVSSDATAQTFTAKPSAGDATNQTLRAVAGSGPWVAVGDLGTILRSDDASTWTKVPLDTNAHLISVGVVGPYFIAVGNAGTVALGDATGTTWKLTQAGNFALRVVAKYGKRILVAGDRGGVFLSDEMP